MQTATVEIGQERDVRNLDFRSNEQQHLSSIMPEFRRRGLSDGHYLRVDIDGIGKELRSRNGLVAMDSQAREDRGIGALDRQTNVRRSPRVDSGRVSQAQLMKAIGSQISVEASWAPREPFLISPQTSSSFVVSASCLELSQIHRSTSVVYYSASGHSPNWIWILLKMLPSLELHAPTLSSTPAPAVRRVLRVRILCAILRTARANSIPCSRPQNALLALAAGRDDIAPLSYRLCWGWGAGPLFPRFWTFADDGAQQRRPNSMGEKECERAHCGRSLAAASLRSWGLLGGHRSRTGCRLILKDSLFLEEGESKSWVPRNETSERGFFDIFYCNSIPTIIRIWSFARLPFSRVVELEYCHEISVGTFCTPCGLGWRAKPVKYNNGATLDLGRAPRLTSKTIFSRKPHGSQPYQGFPRLSPMLV
ncbi:hypothetical protein K438DRAFT_1763231 [Mycena galopus ATCC 62051]|nr:hypothetical protein K438DRAFT_1763231 [Mycena galopus ATCC 62051]